MKVVIDIGGSIFASPIDINYIKRFSELLIKLRGEGYKLMVVVGGGKKAKEYISTARALGGRPDLLDEVGIAITRVNAMLLLAALGEHAVDRIPVKVEEASPGDRILVMGGTRPGQTTDAVAAELASRHGAELLLIASNVDGVYTEDPRTSPRARFISELSSRELLELVSARPHEPGYSGVIDPLAASIIHRSRVRAVFVNGTDLHNMLRAIKGEDFRGTRVVPEGGV
jgi:uridylate kinase